MADAKHTPLSILWHRTHRVVGRVRQSSTGPWGSEECSRCRARRWARPEAYSEDCGGSIDYDTRITRECPKPRAAIAKATGTAS